MSMEKPSEVIQRETKSPSEFIERLCEAYRLYTPIDPEAAGSQMVINAAFVSQAYRRNVRWGGHQVTHEFIYIPEPNTFVGKRPAV